VIVLATQLRGCVVRVQGLDVEREREPPLVVYPQAVVGDKNNTERVLSEGKWRTTAR
jgi:hypothetical protein